MMVEALYGCQFADCAVDVSYPAHMLKMLNGAPVCEDCVDDMGKVDWLNLEKFVPPEQAEITRLRADRNAVIRECAVAIKHAVHSAIYTVGTREGAAPCDYSEAANEAIEQSILALIGGDE